MLDRFFSKTFNHLSSAFWHTVVLTSPVGGAEEQHYFTCTRTENEKYSDCCLTNDQMMTRFFLDLTEDHHCAGIDWFVLGILCILVHIVSWIPRWLIYEPLFVRLRGSSSQTRTLADGQSSSLPLSSRTRQRFSQVLTAASFHIIMAFFAWRVLSHKAWLWDVKSWSKGFVVVEGGGDNEETSRNDIVGIDPDFKFYYLLYAARYISDLISLFFEPSKSDTIAYGIHHVATIGLVLVSAQVGCTRIGGVIMYFFDWADPPMLLGKALLYLSQEPNDVYQQVADICMAIFVVLFVSTRNIVFTVVVYFCLRDFLSSQTTILSLKGMLVVLVGLMTFWLGLIVKTIYHQFFQNKGHVDDLREKIQGDKASKKQKYL